jgi:hypothetical protein
MLPSEYRTLLEGDRAMPSLLLAQLPPQQDCPGVTAILDRLRDSELEWARHRLAHRRSVPEARWELEVELESEGGARRELRLWAVPSEAVGAFHLDWADAAPEERRASEHSRWSLGLSLRLGERPLADFHLQLQLLRAVAPDAPVVVDATACRAHTAAWLREASESPVPPPPSALFALHNVQPEPGRPGGCWLHTHGLVRCGLPEIEMLDVDGAACQGCAALLEAVAGLFLDHEVPDPATPFQPGSGLELVWLPWEQSLSHLRRRRLGGLADRDEHHALPAAVLFAPQRRWLLRRLASPAIYAPLLDGDPLLYVSDMETERMAALARQRLDRFAAIFDRNGDARDWVFLVKLGYPVDRARSAADREHLWFQVHHLAGHRCEATLLNQPYAIAAMREGERAEHDLSLLTDWQILCPYGRYSADTVIHLDRRLATEPDSAHQELPPPIGRS